jgi:hypothetical protein
LISVFGCESRVEAGTNLVGGGTGLQVQIIGTDSEIRLEVGVDLLHLSINLLVDVRRNSNKKSLEGFTWTVPLS